MARVILVQSNPLVNLVYSVDQAVGEGCANRRDDVLLVQFLLRTLREDTQDNGVKYPGFRPPGQDPIDIDGVFGPQTNKYIRFFDAELNRQRAGQPESAKVVTDGRIDPIASGGFLGSLSHKIYKMFLLNTYYAEIRGKPMHEKIYMDHSFPKELTKWLFMAH